MDDDYYPRPAKPRRFYLPSGYTITRLAVLAGLGALIYGAILGDIWLGRLLGHG